MQGHHGRVCTAGDLKCCMWRLQLVTMGEDILEGSPPGQAAAARSVLNGKRVSIITNASVGGRASLASSLSRLLSRQYLNDTCYAVCSAQS